MKIVCRPHGIVARISFLPLLLFGLLLQGCGPEAEAPPVRVATSYWVGYEPFYQAEALGYFPKGAVHLIETPNALSVEQTMRGGTIDALALSLSRTLQYIEQGQPVSIVMILGWSNGADKLIGRPPIGSVADLKGKKVGTELQTVNSYLLYRALEKNGLSLSDIDIIPFSNEGMEDHYFSGKIDAAAVHGRAATILEQAGGKILFNSADIPGEIIDVLVVRNKFIEQYPNRVRQLIEGWTKAVDHIKGSPSPSEIKTYLMKQADFADDHDKILLASMTENREFLSNNGEKLREIIEKRRGFQNAFGSSTVFNHTNFIQNSAFFSIKGRK